MEDWQQRYAGYQSARAAANGKYDPYNDAQVEAGFKADYDRLANEAAAVTNLFGDSSDPSLSDAFSFRPYLAFNRFNPSGQWISSAPPPSVWGNYRTAVLGRQHRAYEMWNAGGLGYAGAPVEWLFSSLTGAIDLGHSYWHGRDGIIYPDDIQTTDIALIVGGGAKTVLSGAGRLGMAAETAVPQVTANRLAGNAFRDEIAGLLKAEGRDVSTEVYKSTPFGKRFIDIEVSKDGQVLGGIETKFGGSRYTPAQRAKDWWLKANDGYIVNVVRDK